MIYISGKMTGIKHFNYPEFNRVAMALRCQGHKVFNPAEIDIDTSGLSKEGKWMAYMIECMPAVEQCSMIYLLNGWEKSRGARQELKKAIELNLTIVQQGDFV